MKAIRAFAEEARVNYYCINMDLEQRKSAFVDALAIGSGRMEAAPRHFEELKEARDLIATRVPVTYA